jgi:hypothetical protein
MILLSDIKFTSLVIDKLCVDSFLYCIIRGYTRKYEKIWYCRITWLAFIILKLMPPSVEYNFVHYTDSIAKTSGKDESLVLQRINLIASLMFKSNLALYANISNILNVPYLNIVESLKANTWIAYFHTAEAIIRARDMNYDVLCQSTLPFDEVICGKVLVYRKFLDLSKVRPRNKYIYDMEYDVLNSYKYVIKMIIYYVLALIYFSITTLFRRNNKLSMNIAVQVLYNNVDMHEKNDLYWMDNDLLKKQTILISSINSKLMGEAKNINMINTSINFRQLFKSTFIFNNPRICLYFLKSFCAFFRLIIILITDRYLPFFLPGLLNAFIYHAIFKALSIKVYTSNSEVNNSGPEIACAMSNVVYVRGTWSNPEPSPEVMTSADVFFAWGSSTVDSYFLSGAIDVTFVKVGFIDGYLVSPLINKVAFLAGNKKIKLGFFDNITSYDLNNLPEDLGDTIDMLCGLLNQYDELTVIYKPKSGDMSAIEYVGREDIINPFVENSRFILITGERKYKNRPAEVGSGLDIVLGYPISSAATETMIAGVPSFHLNLRGGTADQHPWEKRDHNKFIFHSIEEAKEKLSEFIEDISLIPEPDIDIISSVNHFLDHRSKERMQSYIDSLCFDDNRTVIERVAYANQEFNKAYCPNGDCVEQYSRAYNGH